MVAAAYERLQRAHGSLTERAERLQALADMQAGQQSRLDAETARMQAVRGEELDNGRIHTQQFS